MCVHVREGGREHEEVIHERGREEVEAWRGLAGETQRCRGRGRVKNSLQ